MYQAINHGFTNRAEHINVGGVETDQHDGENPNPYHKNGKYDY